MLLSDSSKARRLSSMGIGGIGLGSTMLLFSVIYGRTMPHHYLLPLVIASGVSILLGFILHRAAKQLVPWYALIRLAAFLPAMVTIVFAALRFHFR